ncbi:mediator of RNA polymerase II transcription subunit 31-like protein [Haematococcus lacustris]
MPPKPVGGCDDAQRFAIELEFVQCLSNPHYLTWLAQNNFFSDPAFVAYLDYLKYWQQPTYAKYIQYPHCLFFLTLLQNPDFCKELSRSTAAEFIHTQQFRFWQHCGTQ